MKPFRTMHNVLWIEKKKVKLSDHHQRRYVWGKKGEAFVKNNTLPTVKHEGGSICFGIVWQLGAQGILCK